MKKSLYIATCTFLSFSILSCSADDIEQKTEATINNGKTEVSNNVHGYRYFKVNDTINTSTDLTAGDPIIIKPPRQ